MKRILVIALAVVSVHASAADTTDFRQFVNVWQNPRINHAITYDGRDVYKAGNRYGAACEDAHTDPIDTSVQIGARREIKLLNIGTPGEHYNYAGECKQDGDDGVVLVMTCDDTIFYNQFESKRKH